MKNFKVNKYKCVVNGCETKQLFTFDQWLYHLLNEHGLYYKNDGEYIKVCLKKIN